MVPVGGREEGVCSGAEARHHQAEKKSATLTGASDIGCIGGVEYNEAFHEPASSSKQAEASGATIRRTTD